MWKLWTFGLLVSVLGCGSYVVTRSRDHNLLSPPVRVAVLPFENLSSTEHAAEKVTDHFQAALSGFAVFDVVEYGHVYEYLRRYRIRSTTRVSPAQIDSLATSLDLDYILIGSVLEYEKHKDSYLGWVPQVSFNSRLVDCSEKKSIWVGIANGRGDKKEIVLGIGAIRSVEHLSGKMIDEAVDDLARLFDRE